MPTDVESPPDSPANNPLEYVRPSPAITRRQFRVFLWLIFINTIIFASSVFGPGAESPPSRMPLPDGILSPPPPGPPLLPEPFKSLEI